MTERQVKAKRQSKLDAALSTDGNFFEIIASAKNYRDWES